MKCSKCGGDNRRTSKFCGRCGAALSEAPEPPQKQGPPSHLETKEPYWRPDWRWHLKALLAIYLFLGVVYFALSLFLSKVPEPYRMRDIPREMTPWLKQ